MGRDLPDFDNPPVVETALGVQFKPLKDWAAPHSGLFWGEIRGEYPRVEVVPPLGSPIEEFGESSRLGPSKLKIEVLDRLPPIRCQFEEKSGARLLQIQEDRFVHNWRKAQPTATYPHYENIRPIFEQEWHRFCDFLRRESLGEPEVLQCEVMYVNHLERGVGWDDYGDLQKVVRQWTSERGDFLPLPEGVMVNARYRMPDDVGRLYISLQPAFRPTDAKEILQLVLTARGRPGSSRIQDILAWLDMGREWIVCGFTDFTTPHMHKMWGRKENRR